MHIPLHLLKFVKIHFTTIFSRKIDYLRVGTLVFCTCNILSEYGGNYRNCFILYILIPVGFPVISACTCFLSLSTGSGGVFSVGCVPGVWEVLFFPSGTKTTLARKHSLNVVHCGGTVGSL